MKYDNNIGNKINGYIIDNIDQIGIPQKEILCL